MSKSSWEYFRKTFEWRMNKEKIKGGVLPPSRGRRGNFRTQTRYRYILSFLFWFQFLHTLLELEIENRLYDRAKLKSKNFYCKCIWKEWKIFHFLDNFVEWSKVKIFNKITETEKSFTKFSYFDLKVKVKIFKT